ncbi:MAG: class I SAM-dependent methyltransferase [Patescibacteria group bacterium]
MKDYIKKTVNFYNQNVDGYMQKTVNLQDKPWLNKFASYLPKKAKVLDIGCGYGRDTNFFVAKNFDAYGIDLSPKMIAKAKKFSPLGKFSVMDMLKLKFDHDFFDGIWCSATLPHLNKKDAVRAIKEIKRVLKKNGAFYLNLKEGKGEKLIADSRYKNAKKFYSYYTQQEIKKILGRLKFKVIDFKLKRNPKEKYRNTGIIYLIAKNT